jgi:hypothetical protein
MLADIAWVCTCRVAVAYIQITMPNKNKFSQYTWKYATRPYLGTDKHVAQSKNLLQST